MAATPHVRCAHGKLVHSKHGGHPAPDRGAAPSAVHSDEASQSSHSAQSPHDHCCAEAIVEAPPEHVGPVVAPQVIDWELLPRSLGPAPANAAIAVLMLAPKTSPPSA